MSKEPASSPPSEDDAHNVVASTDDDSLTPEGVADSMRGGSAEPGPESVSLPTIPLRDLVVFPGMIVPLVLGRPRSLRALRSARSEDALLLAVAQLDPEHEDPGADDLHEIGTVVRCVRSLEMPDGTIQAEVEGIARARLLEITQVDPFLAATAGEVEEIATTSWQVEALRRSAMAQFEEAAQLSRTIPPDALVTALNARDVGELADLIASYLDLPVNDRQVLLAELDGVRRLERASEILVAELNILRLERKIHERVEGEIDESQREYWLRENLRAIQDELGQREGSSGDAAEYRERIEAAKLPEEAHTKAIEEVERLERMPPASPEVSVLRTYLDWILDMPWHSATDDQLDIERAAAILDEDHYGLGKAKERILEFLAVRQLVEEVRGPILCFVGPPGVGKTSIGRSIARAMGRKFIRVSLGGVRDEAEIRGHRRTYVGALPGRIIQALRRVGANNPVFMIDEVDKIGADFRGDPSSALLEVLDPEQNASFSDHYLEIPFDLSRVMFIATGNMLDTVPPALRDRLEVIHFPGYIEDEKMHIARDHLVPKQRREHGLTGKNIRFHDSGLRAMIQHYTREAGVRNMEREIAAVCRKVARGVVAGGNGGASVTAASVEKMLGPRRFSHGVARKKPSVGVATGLAYTETGGDVIAIEVSVVDGEGELMLTGQLGDVMKESAQAALSYVRGRAAELGLDAGYFAKRDIHVHVPSGAVPKEGPSAGVAITTALVSAVTGRAARHDLAMTGETTLHGRVLEVGGVREKVLAAHRAGVKVVLLPADNEKDLAADEIPASVFEDIQFIYVSQMREVLDVALT